MGYKRDIRKYCKEINSMIPCKTEDDGKVCSSLIDDALNITGNSHLYWDKDIWEDSGCDSDNARRMLIFEGTCKVYPSDEKLIHPGLCVKYKKSKK